MYIQIFVYFALIHLNRCISNQEDLSISKYYHIGCLQLKPDHNFVTNYVQENSSLPYQTFSSSNMTVELCFRLCRQWMIVINQNHTNCICLYTMTKLFQLNTFFGEVLSVNNCTSNSLQVYSLTKDSDLLPSTLSSNFDWSLDGCYYLHGIQTYRANLLLNNINYTQGIDECRKHCQTTRQKMNYFSFFVSLRRSCYCLPVEIPQNITPVAVRKPLIHCTFLPYIKNAFENVLNHSEINLETVVKINVQIYCSSTYIFDRNLYLCLKFIGFNVQNNFTKIINDENCLPMLIKTPEQWNYLKSRQYPLLTRTFIVIDRNSTYLFDDLFKTKSNSFSRFESVCIVAINISANRPLTFDLVSCSKAIMLGSILCPQKPLKPLTIDESEFKMINNEKKYPIISNTTCPSEFISFNNMCYYVHTAFAFNTLYSEHLCSNKYLNSSLVKFNVHDWGNVNTRRFLGRKMDDVLLELFYYQLEKTLFNDSKADTNRKHWSRLLIGDKTDKSDCALRYFIRSSGSFTILHQCNLGGHPVCQCEPIREKIPVIIPMNETQNSTSQTKTNSTTMNTPIETSTKEINLPILPSNISNQSILSNETIVPMCDNCTELIADEDLINNETNTDCKYNDTLLENHIGRRSKNKSLAIIVAGLLAILCISVTGIIFLVRFIRKTYNSYSVRNGTIDSSYRSIIPGAIDTSNRSTVVYNRLKPRPPSTTIDVDMIDVFSNTPVGDDTVQLLPQFDDYKIPNENLPSKENEEPFHSKLLSSDEK